MKRVEPKTETHTPTKADDVLSQDLSQDLLWGIAQIAQYIRRTNRQASYLIDTKRLPATKLGGRLIVAKKSEIDQAMKAR